MGFFSDFYEAWCDNTTMENVRAQRKIDEARERERGNRRPRSLLDAMGQAPYGRFDQVFPDSESEEQCTP